MRDEMKLAPTIVTLNSLISAYAQRGDVTNALRLFDKARTEMRLKPDVFTANSVMHAFARNSDVVGATDFLRFVQNELQISPTTITMNSMINAHAKRGDLEGAEKVLRVMRVEMHLEPDANTINCIMKAIVNGNAVSWPKLMEYYSTYFGEGRPLKADKYTYGCLLLACKKCRKPEEAARLFDDLVASGIAPNRMHRRLSKRRLLM